MKQQQSARAFVYEVIAGSARILRCFSRDKKVVIPEKIDGYVVKEIGPYAFSVHMDEGELSGKIKEGRAFLSESIFRQSETMCGDDVEFIVLSDNVEVVGAYCFYNCTSLHTLKFGSYVQDWGTGVFTGCHRITLLSYHEITGKRPCLKEILAELHEQLCVEYYDEAGFAKLMFPEFYEEGVENTPARILETHIHGSGLRYRNCFRDRVFNFQEYDRRFSFAVSMENKAFLTRLVLGRLQYPYQLTDEAAARYEAYLIEHIQEIGNYLLGKRELDGVCWLVEGYLKDSGRKDTADAHRGQFTSCLMNLIEKANGMGYGEALTYLLNFRYQNHEMKRKKTPFEL